MQAAARTPSAATQTMPEINVWATPAQRLPRLLRGKTREEVLHQITSVSAQDKTVEAADGARYALVQYGRGQDARRLLFAAEEPQLFIACAATPAQTRALMENYQTHLGLSEKEFTALFEQPAPFYQVQEQVIYQLKPSEQKPFFLLFEHHRPVRVLTQQETEEFIKAQQQAAPQTSAAAPAKPAPARKSKRWKALVSGGTTYEQIYLPHVVPPTSTDEKSAPAKL